MGSNFSFLSGTENNDMSYNLCHYRIDEDYKSYAIQPQTKHEFSWNLTIQF